ncbi:hypothetical protein ONZ45_g7500 [Pleurotus djamor]|nr:hypothetical protein ONZ45_g14252 [Pleurotus djamor]KAJ8515021.1 hypothetical protein ONZ45_g7500 [Pleurotus djamor]
MSIDSNQLLRTSLFQRSTDDLSPLQQLRLSYRRAQAIAKLYAFSVNDILLPTQKYWDLQRDPVLISDGATAALLAIHFNLCCGTIVNHAQGRKDLSSILRDLLAYRIAGQFCLTEVGHGLDAINLETEAVMQEDGSFILNTPHPKAAKFMPPTSPCGIPTIAVVFARLLVSGEDRGVRPFIVSLNDGLRMSPGIVSQVLPQRGGSHYLEHCITSFYHVRLPQDALLGTTKKPKDPRTVFFSSIDRVVIGSLSMAAVCVPGIKRVARIVAQYSKRRRVTDASTRLPRAIITFPTQHAPILTAIAQALVLESCIKTCIAIFTSPDCSSGLRHCIAAIAKAVFIPQTQSTFLTLSERCGAQGIFGYNQITTAFNNLRGASIAEGDVLALSIRFAIEIVLSRIELPPASEPDSMLAQHEDAMIQELREKLFTMAHHRSEEFEKWVLPRCQPLLEAIGHRIAYESARKDHIDEDLVNLYVSHCFKQDPGWYTERGGLSVLDQRKLEIESITRLLPRLDDLLNLLGQDDGITAPIVSDDRWEKFTQSLPVHGSLPGEPGLFVARL